MIFNLLRIRPHFLWKEFRYAASRSPFSRRLFPFPLF